MQLAHRLVLRPAARVRRSRRVVTDMASLPGSMRVMDAMGAGHAVSGAGITGAAGTIGTRRDDARRLWLFDLDNTLHDTSHAIFARIDHSMNHAVAETLGVSLDEANTLRREYWKRYGATMIGLVRHHGVDAGSFLRRSHDFDVRPLIRAERGLRDSLRALPGRKVLLTNAPLHYAKAVLRHLGLLHLFDSLWGIEEMRLHGEFRPKPSPALLRYVLAREGVPAARAVLVEDTLDNLRSARRVGLRTVHVYHPGTPFSKGGVHRPAYVDLQVNSVRDLLLRRRPLRG